MAKLEDAIYHTLQKFGMRLPVQYNGAGMDERIELTKTMAAHIAKAILDAEAAS